MARHCSLVSQAEIKRTITAALEGGVRPGKIEVDHRTGKVTIYPETIGIEREADSADATLERWMKKNG